jgi:hypothetical protein
MNDLADTIKHTLKLANDSYADGYRIGYQAGYAKAIDEALKIIGAKPVTAESVAKADEKQPTVATSASYRP